MIFFYFAQSFGQPLIRRISKKLQLGYEIVGFVFSQDGVQSRSPAFMFHHRDSLLIQLWKPNYKQNRDEKKKRKEKKVLWPGVNPTNGDTSNSV